MQRQATTLEVTLETKKRPKLPDKGHMGSERRSDANKEQNLDEP